MAVRRTSGTPQSPAVRRPKVVVVGAGFGGLHTALGLGRLPVDVTVVDRRNYHLFQPLLYQVATAALHGGAIATPIRWILRSQPHTEVLLGEVVTLDRERRVVHLEHGIELPFEYLVLAPGAQTYYFGHDEWQQHAPGLKGLDDAFGIRDRILLAFEEAELATDPDSRRHLLTFAVIGGGPTGVELAGAIADISRRFLVRDFRKIDPREARILLIEGGPRILPAFGERLAMAATRSLGRLGVDVRTGIKVEGVGRDGIVADGSLIPAGTVLWAAGVRPSPLGRELGLPLDPIGRVRVEPDLSVTEDRRIFVIGDLAAVTQEGKVLPGLAAVAQQEGRHVATCIAADLEGRPRRPFHYTDKGNLATIGRASAIADFAELHIQLSGFIAWMAWLMVHLILLIGFRNRLIVLIQWAWAYFFHDLGVRLITGRPGGDNQT